MGCNYCFPTALFLPCNTWTILGKGFWRCWYLRFYSKHYREHPIMWWKVGDLRMGQLLEVGFCDSFCGRSSWDEGPGLVFWRSGGKPWRLRGRLPRGARVLICGGQGAKAEGEGRVAQGQPVMLVWCNSLQNCLGTYYKEYGSMFCSNLGYSYTSLVRWCLVYNR